MMGFEKNTAYLLVMISIFIGFVGSENLNFNVSYNLDLDSHFHKNIIQLILYFHILPVITTILISTMIYNNKVRKMEQALVEKDREISNLKKQCDSISAQRYDWISLEKPRSRRRRRCRTRKNGKLDRLAGEVDAFEDPPSRDWHETTFEQKDETKSKTESSTVDEPIPTPTPSSSETEMKYQYQGPIQFKTQYTNDSHIMPDKTDDEKEAPIEKVKWDEDPIVCYEIGLDVEDYEMPVPSSKEQRPASSSIATASIREFHPSSSQKTTPTSLMH